MYRQYENPRALQDELDKLNARYNELEMNGQLDEDAIEDYALRKGELEERINFAWQDEEYDANYAREEWR